MSRDDGVPIGHPIAWSNEDPDAQVREASEPSRPTKLRSLQRHPSHSGRTGPRALGALDAELSARDVAILQSVDSHRFLTTQQIETLHFQGHATQLSASRIARRTLRRLGDARVLDHLNRRIGGARAGSTSYVWRVGVVGHRLLAQHDGRPVRRDSHEPGLRFLEHCLGIADIHLSLLDAERRGHLAIEAIEFEPDNWRSYLGVGGESCVLKPDLFAITASGAYEDCWFIELDRGTESIPTVLAQCRRYEAYRRTGQDQSKLGVFPLVVWVTTSEARRQRIERAIAQATSLDASAYRVTTMSGLIKLVCGESS